MKLIRKSLCFLLCAAPLCAEQQNEGYRGILEAKYKNQVKRLKVIDYSDTTKVLGFDFELAGEKSWSGGFNVVEVDMQGTPLYWHDIAQAPVESGIENIRLVELSGRKYLEVIACSHQGNGSLYLYELRNGSLHLLVNCRVMTNLMAMHFSPTIAKIIYRDLDEDGDHDLLINATCLKGMIIDQSRNVVGKYRRIFHYESGDFIEKVGQRDGAPFLMD